MKQGGSRDADNLRLGTVLWCRRAVAKRSIGSSGFTIVETMIVLAVTGVLFMSAVLLIGGQQSRTQFMTAINSFQQELQQTINETANGYYPDRSQYTCGLNPFAPNGAVGFTNSQPDADRQGTNANCIFMGKVMQFAPGGLYPFAREQVYLTYTMVGRRMASDPNLGEASTLYGATGALPRAAAPGNVLYDIGFSGFPTATKSFTQGAKVVGMWYNNNTANTTATVGFISTLPTPSSSGLMSSGAQVLRLYTVPGTALLDETGAVVDDMYPNGTNQPLQPVSSVSICVASGTTKQSAIVAIGANDALSATSSLAVNVTIKSGTTC